MRRVAVTTVLMALLAAPAVAQRICLTDMDGQPVLRVQYEDGREIRLDATVEMGARPLSRSVTEARVVTREQTADGLHVVLALDEGYQLCVRAERYAGAVRVQSVLERVAGGRQAAYYYWRLQLPDVIERPAHWGDEIQRFEPPASWGHGGFHDWYRLDYDGWGVGLVTPMYLLTGGRDVGRGCFLKPFPVERRLLAPGWPGLEQQLILFRADSAQHVSRRWRQLMARDDLFDVPWRRLPERVRDAPAWLREAAVFQGWPYGWSEQTVRNRVAPFDLVIDAPIDAEIIDLARELGSHSAVYLNVMQQWVPRPVEQRGYDRPVYEFTSLLDIADNPRWQRIGEDGKPVVGDTEWYHSYSPCFLAPGYVEHCLDAVDRVLAARPDALFVDNCFFRLAPCSGENAGVHEHRDDYPSYNAAYRGLVEQIAARAHEEGVAMLCNSEVDPGLWPLMDGQMLECLWYCPGWDGREKGYTPMRYAAELWGEAVRRGGTVQMLNYVACEAPERRLQALGFTYAWCRLHGLAWTDWYNLWRTEDDATREAAHRIYAVDLGAPTGNCRRDGDVLWRRFERGAVALNPLRAERACVIEGLSGEVRDVLTGETLGAAEGALEITLGPQSGRVLSSTPVVD